jgi:hypothetical protein
LKNKQAPGKAAPGGAAFLRLGFGQEFLLAVRMNIGIKDGSDLHATTFETDPGADALPGGVGNGWLREE